MTVHVLGSLNLDTILTVAGLPRPGETVLATGRLSAGGGKGANQAVAAARSGARVVMAGAVGDDRAGELLLAGLLADGVDVAQVTRLADTPSGEAFIYVEASGQNSICVAAGANALVDAAAVERLLGDARPTDVLVLQQEIPDDVTLAALRAGRGRLRTILNTAPASPASAALAEWADIVVMNEEEARLVTGVADPTTPLLERSRHHDQAFVITRGEHGALLIQHGAAEVVAALPVDVVDTVGAGDAFVGALAARLAAGATVAGALRYASAAGAWAVGRVGAQPSFATRAQIETLLKEHDDPDQ